ncbi:MAG: alpha-glucan family phosphorylase, partial [Chloroflexi bacterium]|nr:alpha-glucan family phosphorylase [Chloroflexota bacterium]
MYQPNGQKLPERIGRLDELAHNLWWSWYPGARDLFRAVDYPLWSISGHNPVKQLRNLGSDRLETLAADPTFVDLYDSVMSAFDSYMSADRDAWFTSTHGSQLPGPVAYFSMEFAVHVSLPMYAGGLGVLAGDVCKEASDLGLPMVGIGLLFSQGYFLQHIPDHGWQEENYLELDHEDAPVRPVFSPQGGRALTQVQIADRLVSVGAWRVQVGRVNVYLLTSDLDENSPQDRELTARLYTSALEVRIQQEILLGIGGVRVLGVLGIKPSVWHANEGHASFMTIERVREMVQKGTPFPDALQKVGDATVFTTHTPLRAGTDIFPIQLVEKHLSQYLDATGVDKEILLSLGRDNTGNQHFNMTALGLKMAGRRNGVSRLHGEVSRWLWHGLWPQVQQDQVPISHVTNGIHVPTWVAPELANLYERYLGENWLDRHDDTTLWERVLDIPDHKLWATHMLLKSKLISIMRERAQKSLDKGLTAKQMVAKGVFLDPEALTIAFARRYTEYKRPGLIFKDIERLRKIVKDAHRPVQIIFAGKSHPDDTPSKHLLQSVYSLLTDHQFEGRIAFVED